MRTRGGSVEDEIPGAVEEADAKDLSQPEKFKIRTNYQSLRQQNPLLALKQVVPLRLWKSIYSKKAVIISELKEDAAPTDQWAMSCTSDSFPLLREL